MPPAPAGGDRVPVIRAAGSRTTEVSPWARSSIQATRSTPWTASVTDRVLLGAQGHRDARAVRTGEAEGAVPVDPHTLEEGDGGREIARFEAVLERGESQRFPAGRGGRPRGAVPVPRGVPCRRGRAAQGVVPAVGRAGDEGGEHPSLVGDLRLLAAPDVRTGGLGGGRSACVVDNSPSPRGGSRRSACRTR